jgi:hypothetical protein
MPLVRREIGGIPPGRQAQARGFYPHEAGPGAAGRPGDMKAPESVRLEGRARSPVSAEIQAPEKVFPIFIKHHFAVLPIFPKTRGIHDHSAHPATSRGENRGPMGVAMSTRWVLSAHNRAGRIHGKKNVPREQL